MVFQSCLAVLHLGKGQSAIESAENDHATAVQNMMANKVGLRHQEFNVSCGSQAWFAFDNNWNLVW